MSLELQKKLGYRFKDPKLLKEALRHTSYAYERYKTDSHLKSNERLEFVGDAVVGLIVAAYLYRTFPEIPEGKMSKIRASVVCEESLSQLAEKLGVPGCIKLGVGEYQTGGRFKPSILADAMESIVAAIYLDGGYEAAERVMLPFFTDLIHGAGAEIIVHNYKSRLQEFLAPAGIRPVYVIKNESGPDHDRVFEALVTLEGREEYRGTHVKDFSATGSGKSKKDAEQAAAGALLKTLSEKGPDGGKREKITSEAV